MANIRIGFSSDFVLENSEVGIGTTNPTAKLQVGGTLKSDFDIAGVTTLTSYGGFAPQKQSVSTATTIGFNTTGIGTAVSVNEKETGFISLFGEFNTVSEDIVVDDGRILDVSTIRNIGVTALGTQNVYVPNNTTVSVGTLEHVSIGTHFSVPNSGISSRPQDPREGMVRFNDDLNTLEFYNGVEWRQFTVTGASGRGVFAGGSGLKSIEYITISSLGNSQNFGNLSVLTNYSAACSSSTRGMFGGGWTPAAVLNEIEYITIASEGNSIDFGDLSQARGEFASCSSSTRGLWMSGELIPYSNVNTIDYVEISTIGNAQDFGDLTEAKRVPGATSSPTKGICVGGIISSSLLTMETFTISNRSNSVNFGNLTVARFAVGECSSGTRAVFAGGANSGVGINVIDYVTLSSLGNAIDFGNLSVSSRRCRGSSNRIRGVFGGGDTPSIINVMQYITIASTGNSQDFGDLGSPRNTHSACSDSHGGLGGF